LILIDASIIFIIPPSTIVAMVAGASYTRFLKVEKAILMSFSLETRVITWIIYFKIYNLGFKNYS